jgi:hypothetical protein
MYDGLMQGVEAQTLANVYLALENNLEIIPVCSTPFPVHKLWFLFPIFTIVFISLSNPYTLDFIQVFEMLVFLLGIALLPF